MRASRRKPCSATATLIRIWTSLRIRPPGTRSIATSTASTTTRTLRTWRFRARWNSSNATSRVVEKMSDTEPFALDTRLADDTHVLGDFALSRVLLMDDARYTWLILVPRRGGLRE